jgi:GT2 family glycosyltransferase
MTETSASAASIDTIRFGRDGLPLSSVGAETTAAALVHLDVPLEEFGDPYPILRSIWNNVADHGQLRVRYGAGSTFKLTNRDVALLLRLSSFDPQPHSTSSDGREMAGNKLQRNTIPLSCSVVVPCRNEVDNVANVVLRVPAIGTHTELIFVDGASTDGTPDKVEELITQHPDKDIKLLRQTGNKGKGGASFQGLTAASGDTVMILDADMTVRPEDLPRFHDVLAEGIADFANGTRLLYPMATGAMPGLNNAGNHFFSRYLSWLVNTKITDTLCGTKAVRRRDFDEILRAQPLFGHHDPWGDFDLIMGAAYAGLRIIDVPITYEAREAGESKMRPFSHGLALGQTCLAGARRLKIGRGRRTLRSKTTE